MKLEIAGIKAEWVGEAIVVVALAWWFIFYSDVATLKKEPLSNFVNCIFVDCIKPEGKFMLKAMGKTPYEPTVFWIGFVIGAVGLVLGKASSKKKGVTDATRQCPYCAEPVKLEAKLCKHCGKDIPLEQAAAKEPTDDASEYAAALKRTEGSGSSAAPKAVIEKRETRNARSSKPVLVLVAAIGVVGGVGYYWWTKSPEYALRQLTTALRHGDQQKMREYVDVDQLTSSVVAGVPNLSESDAKALFDSIQEDITSFVVDKDDVPELIWGLYTRSDDGSLKFDTSTKYSVTGGGDRRVASVSFTKGTAGEPFIIQLEMVREGGVWRVTGAERFAQIAPALVNVANAEIELSAKRVDEKLSVISVKDSGDATVDPNANTIRLPASYQISGVNGVKAFSVRFCICDREAIGANGCRQDRAIAVWDVESAEGMVMKPGSTTSIDKAVKIPHTDALALVLLPHERWAFTYGIRSAVFEDGSRFNIVDQVTLPWK